MENYMNNYFRVLFIRNEKIVLKRMNQEEINNLNPKEIVTISDMCGNIIIDNRKREGV